MSNKVRREAPHKVIGRLGGEPETSALNDESLMEGLSVNGAPPLIGIGDEKSSLVQVRCHCGTVVAVLWSVDRRARTGLPPVIYLDSTIIQDPEARPPVTVRVNNLVEPPVSLVADCPAHGRHSIDGKALTALRRKVETRLMNGGERMAVLNLARVLK